MCTILTSNEQDIPICKSVRAASRDCNAQNKRCGATYDFPMRQSPKHSEKVQYYPNLTDNYKEI